MSLHVLDTDILSLYQRGHSTVCQNQECYAGQVRPVRKASETRSFGQERASKDRKVLGATNAMGHRVDHCLLGGTWTDVPPSRGDAPAEPKMPVAVVEKCMTRGLGVKQPRLFSTLINHDSDPRYRRGAVPEVGSFPIVGAGLGTNKLDASNQPIPATLHHLIERIDAGTRAGTARVSKQDKRETVAVETEVAGRWPFGRRFRVSAGRIVKTP